MPARKLETEALCGRTDSSNSPPREHPSQISNQMVVRDVAKRFARFLLALSPPLSFIPCSTTLIFPARGPCRAFPSAFDGSVLAQEPVVLCQQMDEAERAGDSTTNRAIAAQLRRAGYFVVRNNGTSTAVPFPANGSTITTTSRAIAAQLKRAGYFVVRNNGTSTAIPIPSTGPTIMELANEAMLKESTEASVATASQAALCRLSIIRQLPRKYHDAQWRQFADAAFKFALAGAEDEALFEALADGSHQELLRMSNKIVLTPKILRGAAKILERHACAGTRETHLLFDVGASLLKAGGWDTKRRRRDDCRPLRNLLNHHRNRTASIERPPANTSFTPVFRNSSAPLLLDIGCSFGSMCLGYAQKKLDANVLGVDTDGSLLRYSRGIAKRSGLCDRLQLIWGYGLDAVRWVRQNYSGELAWVTMNSPFGTYQWERASLSPNRADFLGSLPALFAEISATLRERGGRLLLQSRVAEVAVHLRAEAEKQGLTVVPGLSLGISEVSQPYDGEGAFGPGWLCANPLGVMAESEAGSELENLPMHRCVLHWHEKT